MNPDNLLVWTQGLRTTDKPQGTGKLHQPAGEAEDGIGGYCCLGLGCVIAGVPEISEEYEAEEDGHSVTLTEHQFLHQTDLPPVQFHRWLGLTQDDDSDGHDVAVDWPRGTAAYLCRNDRSPMEWSCSGLNDNVGLTFAQIADVLDYFGVCDWPLD